MRLDKRLTRITTITPSERYFLACWFNMVHQASLDSFRVRAMNPTSATRELLRCIQHAQASREDRLAILEEAQQLFDSDPVLKLRTFSPLVKRILPFLGDGRKDIADNKQPGVRQLTYFLKELSPLLDTHYIQIAFSELADRFPEQAPAAPLYDEVRALSAGLLSTLLDRDFFLESLFTIYSRVLINGRGNPDYNFSAQFARAREILSQEPQDFTVTFAVDLISNPEELPTQLGPLALSEEAPFELRPGHSKSNYLSPQPRRRFMTISNVLARDPRAAGLRAYQQVTDVINLLRFEYEQSKILIPTDFAILKTASAQRGGRIYPIPRIVPNPIFAINGNEVANFVHSVNELISGEHFGADGRDRITSAFRLYREGRDQDSIEAKLVNWWTALEYLVRGNQAGGGIGKSIEDALAPVLGLAYVPKHLLAVRNLLVDADINLVDAAGQAIELRRLTTPALYDVLKDAQSRTQVRDALEAEPFAQQQIDQFLEELAVPSKLSARLRRHEQRVRWQISRLWRTRCDIVHSAMQNRNNSLLCSNLESYLKAVLLGLLSALRTIPTLSGPHEYFDRESGRYEEVMADLKAQSDQSLRDNLPV